MTDPAPGSRELPLVQPSSSQEPPELEVRLIPHAIRHGAALGALRQVRPGSAMVLAAPHDPLPLLGEIREQEGDAVVISYLQRGPDLWRLRLDRLR